MEFVIDFEYDENVVKMLFSRFDGRTLTGSFSGIAPGGCALNDGLRTGIFATDCGRFSLK